MQHPTPPPAMPILVADTPAAFREVAGCLGGSFALRHVGTVEQARAQLHGRTPLVLCGAHFDDGRMYELLRWLKSTDGLAQVPFLATRVGAGDLDDSAYESVKVATAVLGGNGFVDLYRWQVTHGPDEAARRLAERVRALLD